MEKKALIDYFDTMAPKRDYWKHKNRYYYNYLEGFIEFLVPSDKKVLEIGSGTGSLLRRLNPSHGLGIDISSKMVAHAKKHRDKNIEFRTASVGDVKELFDYIVISDALGYSDDVEKMFTQTNRCLKAHGRLVVTQYSALWEPILRLASWLKLRQPDFNQNWLSLSDLKNFGALAGYEVVKDGTKMLMPIYIPLISIFLNRIVANVWPFSKLGLFHFVVFKKTEKPSYDTPPSFSIVVPARNEAGTVEKIVNELPELGSFTEIIFVEGHSSDHTLAEIKRVAKQYSKTKRIKYAVQTGKGKGDAVRLGFDMAEGDILTIYDADMTVPAAALPKFYHAIVENRGDFINGSRLVYPLEKQSMRLLNFFGNKFFSFAFSAILGQTLKDTLCGTKTLWASDYHDLQRNRSFFGDFDPFGDFDLLFGAAKLNLKIVDMPIHYKERTYGQTNIQRWSHGWLLLRMVIFSLRKIKFV